MRENGLLYAGFFNFAETAALFRAVAEISPRTISLIAIIATLNTILAQMTMASRVIYGLARDAELPRILAGIHPLPERLSRRLQ